MGEHDVRLFFWLMQVHFSHRDVMVLTVRQMIKCGVWRATMGAVIALLLCGAAGAQQATQTGLVIPSDQGLAIMIKTTLIAYNNGNLTGNYTVLRDLAAPSFREANSPSRLAEIFQDLRRRKIDIGPIVLLQPRLLRKPWIDENRLLRLDGFFASKPEQVNFNLAYQEVEGRWRLFTIGVTTERVQDAAATPAGNPPTAAPTSPSGPANPFGLPDWLMLGK